LLSCLGIVIGTIIGSGIFIVPAIMIKILPSPQLIFLVWVLSSIVSITGGLVIAGMGAAFPDARDLLDYYRVLFPKWVSWLFNFFCNWIINPCGTVAVAFVFAEYFGYFLPMGPLQVKLVAIGLIAALVSMDAINTRTADRFQILFTGIKVAAIILLISMLLVPGKGNLDNFRMSGIGDWSTLKIIGAFVAACTGALSAFDGWYMVSHLTPEVKGGAKTVGRSIVLGIIICMGLYLLTTFAYQYVLTPAEMGASNLVAITALEKVIGGWAAGLIALLVLVSTASGVNANLLASSRLMASSADQKMLPAFLSKKNSKNIPVNAFITIFVFESVLVLTGSFEIFLNLSVFTIWVFITLLTAGFLYVYTTKKMKLPGFRKLPMVLACALLILFGIVYLSNFFI